MGQNKLALAFNGATLLESIVERFNAEFGVENVALGIGEADRFPDISAVKVTDNYIGCGPLGGLQSALAYFKDDVFLVAGDMPYAEPKLARKIIELSEDLADYDACALVGTVGTHARVEPLFAFYSYRTLPIAENLLKIGTYKMNALLESVHTKILSADEFVGFPIDEIFTNINRPEDYKRLFVC